MNMMELFSKLICISPSCLSVKNYACNFIINLIMQWNGGYLVKNKFVKDQELKRNNNLRFTLREEGDNAVFDIEVNPRN